MAWSDIVTNLKSELQSGSLVTKELEFEGVRHVFRTLKDLQDFLAYAEGKSAIEAGTDINRPRGYVKWKNGR